MSQAAGQLEHARSLLGDANAFAQALQTVCAKAPGQLHVPQGSGLLAASEILACLLTGQPLCLRHPDWPDIQAGAIELDGWEDGTVLVPTGGTSGSYRYSWHGADSLRAAVTGLQTFLGEGPLHTVNCLPLHHVSGLMPLLRALLSGGRCRLSPWREVQQYADEAYLLSLVPTQLQELLAAGHGPSLARYRTILLGGAPAADSLLREAHAAGLNLLRCYGMSETAALVAATPLSDFRQDPLAPLRALPHAEFRIENNNTITRGRLLIRSKARHKGYVLADGTRQPLDEPWLSTEDDASLSAEGALHIHGRLDRCIISGGENVSLEEVERLARDHSGRDCLALAQPDEHWGECHLLFSLAPAAELPALADYLEAQLGPQGRPRQLLAVERLPYQACSGKIDWPRVRELLQNP